jgi:hypothetical protein
MGIEMTTEDIARIQKEHGLTGLSVYVDPRVAVYAIETTRVDLTNPADLET